VTDGVVRQRVCAYAGSIAAVAAIILLGACFRGSLPPRQFYRLTAPETVASVGATPPALVGSLSIRRYETPGIYASGNLVYRVGSATYGEYPSREWAIPLGEMLGALSEGVIARRGLTSGRVVYDPAASERQQFEWRGVVREFDEVDAPSAVSASVVLDAKLVRVADDSVIWSGSARETIPVADSRNMDAVVNGLSLAAARVIARLADDAAATVRRLAASGAQGR
jgi:ABC-type uncharacterized transport system auxiliary subunit